MSSPKIQEELAVNNIGARFSLVVGLFGVLFSAVLLYQTWNSARAQTDKVMDTQAKLALKFETAIRGYVADEIRPEMRKRIDPDEFVIEAMSTSYVARQIVEEVRTEFPDYILKFSSDNPRNPVNMAGPEELKMLQYFRDHPDESRWQGKLSIDGRGVPRPSECDAHRGTLSTLPRTPRRFPQVSPRPLP